MILEIYMERICQHLEMDLSPEHTIWTWWIINSLAMSMDGKIEGIQATSNVEETIQRITGIGNKKYQWKVGNLSLLYPEWMILIIIAPIVIKNKIGLSTVVEVVDFSSKGQLNKSYQILIKLTRKLKKYLTPWVKNRRKYLNITMPAEEASKQAEKYPMLHMLWE